MMQKHASYERACSTTGTSVETAKSTRTGMPAWRHHRRPLSNVQARCKHHVPLDGRGRRRHLLPQCCVAHDAGGVPELTARLIQPHYSPHNGALQEEDTGLGVQGLRLAEALGMCVCVGVIHKRASCGPPSSSASAAAPPSHLSAGRCP